MAKDREGLLGSFDGFPVNRAGLEVRNIAGGLRDSMKIDPQKLDTGATIHLVIEAEVGDINHKHIVKGDPEAGWTRVHVTNATAIMVVDRDLVAEMLEKHKAQVALAKDDETGQQRMEHEAELELEHTAGRHKRLKKGCPICQREKDLAAAEAAEAKAAGDAAKKAAKGAE